MVKIPFNHLHVAGTISIYVPAVDINSSSCVQSVICCGNAIFPLLMVSDLFMPSPAELLTLIVPRYIWSNACILSFIIRSDNPIIPVVSVISPSLMTIYPSSHSMPSLSALILSVPPSAIKASLVCMPSYSPETVSSCQRYAYIIIVADRMFIITFHGKTAATAEYR